MFERWFKRARDGTPLALSAEQERSSAVPPASLPPPETPAIHVTTHTLYSGGQRLGGGGGSSMRSGDLVEIALPVVLIAAALYFGNRAPHLAAPAVPSVAPSFSSSPSGPRPSSVAPATQLLGSGAPAAQPAPSDRSPSTSPGSAPSRSHAKQSVLSVDLDEKGQILGVEVLETNGAAADTKAIAEVRKWAFTPTIFKGTPVRSRITVRYP